MEIKVQCDCGQKFKFDVEPVHGRMPFTVNCPVCGADGTARANVILQQLLPPAPITAAFTPPPAPAPAPAPAPMRPAGLNVNRPPALKPAAPAPEAAAPEDAEDDSADAGGVREIKLGWKVWGLIILFVCFGLVGTFDKWSRRISGIRELVTWVKELAGGESEETTAEEPETILFALGEATMIFKHGNQAEVAAACAEFWTERFNQKLFLSAPTNCVPGESVYLLDADHPGAVLPATNGVVELVPPYEMSDKLRATLLAMAEFVSRKLHCTNVCAFMGEDIFTGTLVVHDSGTPRFRCDRTVTTIGRLEKVKVDGEAWAREIGFKPGAAGFKGFTMDDAEALTKHLGFQPAHWDQAVPCIILSTKLENP